MPYDDAQPQVFFWILIVVVLIIFTGTIFYVSQKNPHVYDTLPPSTRTIIRQARTYIVSYKSGVFSPTNIRIHTGDSVRFQNNSTATLAITSHGDGDAALAEFHSNGTIPSNGEFVFTFAKIGIFAYHNNLDDTEAGTVIVRP